MLQQNSKQVNVLTIYYYYHYIANEETEILRLEEI